MNKSKYLAWYRVFSNKLSGEKPLDFPLNPKKTKEIRRIRTGKKSTNLVFTKEHKKNISIEAIINKAIVNCDLRTKRSTETIFKTNNTDNNLSLDLEELFFLKYIKKIGKRARFE